MAHPNEPLPLFSPTQVASSSNEQVLHSIFSPTLQGGVTSFKYNSRGKHGVQRREKQKRERIALAAKRVAPKTPAANKSKKVSISIQPSQLPPARSPDEFFSPVGRNSAPFIPATISKAVLKTPANLARSAFRSPRYARSPDFESPVSTISALTNASTCSFKSLPIDMLSFEYVSSCDSPEALQHIVETLSSDGSKHHYPSLLKKAQQQLESINEKTTVRHDNVPSVRILDIAEIPKDSTLYMSSTKDESSLALSLSSSVLDGTSAEVPTVSKVPNHRVQANGATNKANEPFSQSTSGRRIALSPPTNSSVDATREAKPKSEVEKLSEKVSKLKSFKGKDTKDLENKLKSLEDAKNEAERKVVALEKAVLASSSHAREANAELSNVREESRLLKDLLDGERNAARSELHEAKAVEEGLRRKMEAIAAQLAQCKEQNADITKSMESRFRRQVERERAKREGDVRTLQQSLQNTQMTVNAMQEERNSTLRSIHQALGKSTDGVRNGGTTSFLLVSNRVFIIVAYLSVFHYRWNVSQQWRERQPCLAFQRS